MSQKVIISRLAQRPNIVIGLDVSYKRNSDIGYAAAVAIDTRDLRVIEYSVVSDKVSFPYIPGYLAFREAPLMLKALLRIKSRREAVLMINGHGIAHPRGLGIASHIGVVMNLPSIGVAKSLLVGEIVRIGGREVIVYGNKIVGIVLSSEKSKTKYYATIGHRVSLEDVEYYMNRFFNNRYRVAKPPYPIYLADKLSREFARGQRTLT